MNRRCRDLENLTCVEIHIAFVLVSTLVIQRDDGLQEGRNM
jgi:hypothetical protein